VVDEVFIDYSGDVLIQDPVVGVKLAADHASASLTFQAMLINPTNSVISATVDVKIGDTAVSFTSGPIWIPAGGKIDAQLGSATLQNPQLWWPNGYGDQYLYTCTLDAKVNGVTGRTHVFKLGIR
jgi:beta-galactosidase/beta-glucuronidase